MSSTSHLTTTLTAGSHVNKRHSSFNLHSTPSHSSSESFHTGSPNSHSNNLQPFNADTIRKQSITITENLTPTSSVHGPSLNVRRKLSAISLPIPWYKRTRSPSDAKASSDSITKQSQQQQQRKSPNLRKMSRDRLLTLDRLFSTGTHTSATTNDDEQISPTSEFTVLDDSMRSNEKPSKSQKENGYLHNAYLMTR